MSIIGPRLYLAPYELKVYKKDMKTFLSHEVGGICLFLQRFCITNFQSFIYFVLRGHALIRQLNSPNTFLESDFTNTKTRSLKMYASWIIHATIHWNNICSKVAFLVHMCTFKSSKAKHHEVKVCITWPKAYNIHFNPTCTSPYKATSEHIWVLSFATTPMISVLSTDYQEVITRAYIGDWGCRAP